MNKFRNHAIEAMRAPSVLAAAAYIIEANVDGEWRLWSNARTGLDALLYVIDEALSAGLSHREVIDALRPIDIAEPDDSASDE